MSQNSFLLGPLLVSCNGSFQQVLVVASVRQPPWGNFSLTRLLVLVHRIVHLDLKGAPPKYSYYEKLFPFLKKHGANGILIEYEDTFPYWGEFQVLRSKEAYSLEEVKGLLKLAAESDLTVIPLVQTFGHFEFVLKHDKFRHLREIANYPMALCPSMDESAKIVCRMLDQVIEVHQSSVFFHIGADEVFHLNECARCKSRQLDKSAVYASHVTKICRHVTIKGKRAVMWDDVFRSWSLKSLKECGLGSVVEPMIWYYGRDYCLGDDLFTKYGQVFESVWVATAFKGATGACMYATDISLHVDNHLMWSNKVREESSKISKFRGYAITGWQRYDHYAVLCELLPVAVPSLCLCLRTLITGAFTKEVHRSVSEELGFASLIPCNPFIGNQLMPQLCDFPGKEIYQGANLLLRLSTDYERFLKDERLNGWMTPYHVEHNYTNPVHVQHIMLVGADVYNNMTLLQARMRLALEEVFSPHTVDEWLELHVNPKVRHLEKIMDDARKQIQIGGRTMDYDVTTLDTEMNIP